MYKQTVFYSHADFAMHDTGMGHPESAARLAVIEQALAGPEFAGLLRRAPEMAADVENLLSLVHGESHIAKVFASVPREGGLAYLDADTPVSPGSLHAALLAVSAACQAVAAVCGGGAERAFCALRPPGHHAEPERAMGFCLFNNAAIAAMVARVRLGLRRVAIVDFDVHHGNGTQAAFYDDPSVMYVSSHQWPHYPGGGRESEIGAGNIVNLPLPAGAGGAEMLSAYRLRAWPAVRAFSPELLIVSAGFDAHRDDPLAGLHLSAADYYALTADLCVLADECAEGRLVSVLEGGYCLPALADSVAEHVRALIGLPALG